MALKEALELEMLVLTGNGSKIFTCTAQDQSNYRRAKSLEEKKLIRLTVSEQSQVDIDEERVRKFSTELTPEGMVLYSQLVRRYSDEAGK